MDFFTEEKIIKAYEKMLKEAKKKECPDGHEWDEKTQECLPSSTGIKEEEVDEKKKECPEGHEWDERTQECLPSSTGIKEGKMQKGFWVVLSGKGGELDKAFVKDKKGIKSVLMDWSSTVSDGDTIKIEKGESER